MRTCRKMKKLRNKKLKIKMDRQLENELYNDFEKAMDDNISKMLNDAGYNYTEAVNNSNLTVFHDNFYNVNLDNCLTVLFLGHLLTL
jgi:hypothetical protein